MLPVTAHNLVRMHSRSFFLKLFWSSSAAATKYGRIRTSRLICLENWYFNNISAINKVPKRDYIHALDNKLTISERVTDKWHGCCHCVASTLYLLLHAPFRIQLWLTSQYRNNPFSGIHIVAPIDLFRPHRSAVFYYLLRMDWLISVSGHVDLCGDTGWSILDTLPAALVIEDG